MSFSLKLGDGDLSLRGSTFDIVSGREKLVQDIDLWLKERYGADRFHVRMGSILQEFIGGIISDSSKVAVQKEILRILQNYKAVQDKAIKENPQKFSASEMLVSIEDVQVTVLFDTIYATVKFRNGTNTVSTLTVTTGI